MSPSVLAAVEKVLGAYHPRFFQSDSQATQYTNNLGHKKPGRFGGGKGFARLQADFDNANQDLRDGKIDEPSTKKFVDMMDASMEETPEDLIINHVATPDAFGLTADRLPELEELTGDVIADRGYLATNLGTPAAGGQGMIQMRIAAPKGTRVAIPARSGTDRAIFMDRDQEMTITKVKPDGRGGYIMSVVATPKTPGETPLPESGHQGSGMPQDREGNIKKLEDAASARETGSQPLGALPGEALENPPEGMTPEQVRAQRRAAVLGRGPAAVQPAESTAAGLSPTPAPAVTQPAPREAPNVPAPAPVETPQTPPAPETPNGATSVVTGEPATSFRDAASAASLEAPSAGPRRKEWNSAYTGITSGKQHPADMLRELEADIATNKKLQATEVGRGDSLLADDISKQEKLADLIRSHFTLGTPQQRQAKADVRNELDQKAAAAAKKALTRPGGGTDRVPGAKKTATEAARPGPLAKVAPKRTDGTPESRAKGLGTQQEKDIEDDRLNAEQRSRWSDAVGAEPASMRSGDTAGNILLDETADLLRNGRVTRPKAVQRLRDQAKEDDTPEANYLRKIADVIEADESKPAKRVPLKKRAPKAAPDVEAAQKKLEGRTEKNILTGLNGLTVGDLRALAEKWGVETRGEDKKLKLKAALSKELAAKWKATPELQRKGGAAKEDVAADMKQAAPAKLAAPAKKVAAPKVLTDEETIAKAQKTLDRMGSGAPIKRLTPSKLGPATAADDAALAKAEKTIANLGKKATPEVKALKAIEVAPDTPPVLAKAAKAAAREAEIEAAFKAHQDQLSDPNKPTVSASRLKVGEKLRVQQDTKGNWSSSARKTGAKTLTVSKIDRAQVGRQTGYKISGTDEDGNEITLQSIAGQNVVHRALSAPAKKAARTELTKKERDDNLPELSNRVLAGEAAGDVINDIRGRLGVAPEGPAPEVDLGSPLKGNTVRQLREMATDRGLNPPQRAKKQDLIDLLERTPEAPATAPEPRKIPGIDTAERARLQQRAREVLADMQAQQGDPFDELAKQMPGQTGHDLVKMAKEIRDEVETTSGPSKVSVEDRVAVRMLARIKPEYRDGVLAEMSEKDRKHLLDISERVALEDKRVKKGGHDLDKIMADAGIKRPAGGPAALDYATVENLLGKGKVDDAKAELKRLLSRSDDSLKSYRAGLEAPGQTQANKEFLGKRITEELERAQWIQSAAAALHTGDSPELVTKKEVIRVVDPELGKISVAQIKADAKAAGIKLPEAATTKDEVLTELAREMIRRQQAGDPIDLTPPAPLPKKKAAPKPPAAKIDARTLVPDQAYAEAPGSVGNDKNMLDRIQRLLDGDTEALRDSGLPKNATPAAIGRWLDNWSGGAGSPGYAAATNTILVDGAKRRLKNSVTPEDIAIARAELADAEANTQMYRAQSARWKALAEALKKTKRSRATPAAKADVAADLPPAKKVSKTVQSNLSPLADDDLKKITESPQFGDDQKATVAAELARRTAAKKAPGPISSRGFTGDAAAVARIVESSRTPVKETLARAAKSAPPARKVTKKAAAAAAAQEQMNRNMAVLTRGGMRNESTGPTTEAKATPREIAAMTGDDFTKAVAGGRVTKTRAIQELELHNRERTDRLAHRKIPAGSSGGTESAQSNQIRADISRDEGIIAELRGTPAKKAASSTETKAEVKREVAAAKKVTKTAAPSTGGTQTREELMDMSPGELKDIEDELNLERPTLLKSARVDAILAARSKAAPVKKAAAKKTAATGSSPAAPGPPVESLKYKATGGDGRIIKRERPNADEPIYLPNGGNDQGLMHLDSELGALWADLYMDDREPNSFINEIARMGDQMGRDKLELSKFIDRLREMKKTAADQGVADRIQRAIDAIDAPPLGRKVDLPADAPKALRDAFEKLAAIPTARIKVPKGSFMRRVGTGSFEPGKPSLIEKKEDIIRRLLAGDEQELLRLGAAERELNQRDFHEGTDAATTMWDIMQKATSDPEVQAWLKRMMLEARKKREAK
jgi:hypothetical protein